MQRIFKFCRCRFGSLPAALNPLNRRLIVYVLAYHFGFSAKEIAVFTEKSISTIYQDMNDLHITVLTNKKALALAKEVIAYVKRKK